MIIYTVGMYLWEVKNEIFLGTYLPNFQNHQENCKNTIMEEREFLRKTGSRQN